MSMLHAAFVLDHEEFRRHIAPILAAIDQGNLEPLRTEAEAVIQSTRPEEWLLQEQGTMLESVEPCGYIDKTDIGYWLLVIMTTFLQRAPSMGTNWSVLLPVLKHIGWSMDDAWLLGCGIPTVSLLKPDCYVASVPKLNGSEPYWYWMIPTQSYKRGWLPPEEIHRLEPRLEAAREAIMALDETVVDASYGIGPYGPLDNVARLRDAYYQALKMLKVASKVEKALYMVIS